MIYNGRELFIITGLARSGTTYLSKLLNSDRNCLCVTDPINVFFKAYICELYYMIYGIRYNLADISIPTGFMDTLLVKKLENADLTLNIFPEQFDIYKKAIAANSSNYTPLIAKRILSIPSCTNFKDLFENLLNCIFVDVKPWHKAVGIKTVWSESLIPVLLNTYRDLKTIHILRDPRAVVASNYITENKRYPLLYNIRDWRKSVYYYFYLQNRWPNNFKSILYKELITNYEKSINTIFSFIGLSNVHALDSIINDNSSYNNPVENKHDYLNRWKNVLPLHVQEFIERTCYWEMRKVFNFEGTLGKVERLNGKIEYESLSNWCKNDFMTEENYTEWVELQNNIELLRIEMIRSRINAYENVISSLFYSKKYYRWLLDENIN